jgi:hypothetical protein
MKKLKLIKVIELKIKFKIKILREKINKNKKRIKWNNKGSNFVKLTSMEKKKIKN